jgi:site-specific recombinase XerD
MDRYSQFRNKTNWTWIKEIELLRQFFEFCRDREWTTKNPGRSLRRPVMREANDVVPYTREENCKDLGGVRRVRKASL